MNKTILAAIAALAVSCSASKDALNNQKFTITELNGTEYVSKGDAPAYISFSDGKLSTSVGGNVINASYKLGKDGSINISKGATTMMMVPEEFREDEYVDAVNKVASYEIKGDTVCFLDKNGSVLIKAQK